jgi:D-glycero-alpha-D-manno-heptose-7-phosphate kinase
MIISKTPLRISYIGGGSDILRKEMKISGKVISTTIDKFIYIFLSKNFYNSKYIIRYSKTETVDKIENIQHNLIREILKFKKCHYGLEISVHSDVPSSGCGLGSSSALCVGLVNSINCLLGLNYSKYELAMEAYHIERNILKVNVGFQDHFNSVFGNFRQYTFPKKGKIKHTVITSKLQKRLKNNTLIFYSGINRKANKVLNNYKKYNTSIDSIALSVQNFKNYLDKNNLKNCGNLIQVSWDIKKKFTTLSSRLKILSIFDKLVKKNIVYGGKIMGAGGGGFLLILAKIQNQFLIKKRLSKFRLLNFNIYKSGSKIIYNDQLK